MSKTVLSVIALSVAGLSFLISALTYYRNSWQQQMQRQRVATMRIVAARSAVLWDYMQTFIAASVHGFAVDQYLPRAAKLAARRLEEALDQAVGLGLLDMLVGQHKHALQMYAAYVASLNIMAELDDPDAAPVEEWIKQHAVMGMIRLLDTCLSYEPDVLGETARAEIEGKVGKMRSHAWSYIAPSDEDNASS